MTLKSVDSDANISFVEKRDELTPSATIREKRRAGTSEDFQEVLENVWLGGRDSNPDTQIQSLQSYH